MPGRAEAGEDFFFPDRRNGTGKCVVRLSLFYGQDMIYDIEENKGKIVVGGRKK